GGHRKITAQGPFPERGGHADQTERILSRVPALQVLAGVEHQGASVAHGGPYFRVFYLFIPPVLCGPQRLVLRAVAMVAERTAALTAATGRVDVRDGTPPEFGGVIAVDVQK